MSRVMMIPGGMEDDEDEDFFELSSLKISIIPDIRIGAAMHGDDFNCDLEPNVENWFDDFREMYNTCKRSPAVQHKLKTLFMQHPEPLLLALKLFAHSPGCNNLKNKNLALFILETICDLYRQHPVINLSCDDNTRLVAFNFLKTCGVAYLCKAVLETYELYKIRDLLVPKLKELIAKGHYKDAAYWTMHLQVTHIFGIFDLVFPLILQDKVYLAEEYLCVAKEQQLTTVQFLDSLLNKQKTVYDHCDDILDKYKYVDIKHDILSYRPLSKLVTRLVKRYKIDAQHTPNLNFTKACSYLHYLYHKYSDGGMSMESWRELAHDAASSHSLQLDLINKIASCGDMDEAIYWVKHFRIAAVDCPHAVQQQLQRVDKHKSSSRTRFNSDLVDSNDVSTVAESVADAATIAAFGNDTAATTSSGRQASGGNACASSGIGSLGVREKEFLTLQLPADCIILVDDKTKFLNMLTYLESRALIAFDSEWKPSVCNDNVVALMQLATFERVYLVDCQAFPLHAELWRLLGRKIFNNLEILKVGFSLHQDLRMLQKSLPLQLNLQASAYLDLRELWRRLKYLQVVDFPYGQCTHAGESLTVLTKLCLGKKLDKSNQCSNWSNRPLRYDQIHYAALDAHCLLQIYQVLSELFLRMGIDMDQVIEELTTTKTGYLFRVKRAANAPQPQQTSCTNEPTCQTSTTQAFDNATVSALDIKFICDSMLYGLSRELRKLGIDCVDISTNSIDINHYVQLAKNENRYVLTRDARHATFLTELPATQCIYISSDTSVQQVRNVMQYFRIGVHARNLFTRCLQCNSNEFILALRDELLLMRFGQLNDSREGDGRYSRGSSGSSNFVNYATHIDPYDKTYNLLNVNEHIMHTKTTYRGKPIKLNRIKPHIIHSKEHFLICDNCGICTWDGAHPLHNSITDMIIGIGTSGSVSVPADSINAASALADGRRM